MVARFLARFLLAPKTRISYLALVESPATIKSDILFLQVVFLMTLLPIDTPLFYHHDTKYFFTILFSNATVFCLMARCVVLDRRDTLSVGTILLTSDTVIRFTLA